MIVRLVIFLIINFGALAIASFITRKGVPSAWYAALNKAPWTPPGWLFGVAWTTIMICFSIYMAYLWPEAENKNLLLTLFILQWILCVGWNLFFFNYHNIIAGMVIISCLTVLIGLFLLLYWPELKLKTVLILPYFIWLLIATSLNGYILFKN